MIESGAIKRIVVNYCVSHDSRGSALQLKTAGIVLTKH
jgi:hypothetical protein